MRKTSQTQNYPHHVVNAKIKITMPSNGIDTTKSFSNFKE